MTERNVACLLDGNYLGVRTGPDEDNEPIFTQGNYNRMTRSWVTEKYPTYYFAIKDKLNPGKSEQVYSTWVEKYYHPRRILERKNKEPLPISSSAPRAGVLPPSHVREDTDTIPPWVRRINNSAEQPVESSAMAEGVPSSSTAAASLYPRPREAKECKQS